MKKILLYSLSIFLLTTTAFAQDFLGLSTGNYGGVTGAMLQPASIVDSRFKFDINLFSTGVNYSNNYFLLNRDAILKFNKNNFNNYQTFKGKYLSQASLATGDKVFFNINNRTQLPLSFMATLSQKSAIAFSIQSRSMIQGRNFSQDLANLAYNGFFYNPLNNRPVDVSNFSIHSLSWVEVGLTYGRVLYSSKKHFIKAAFTGKYLAGIASLNMSSNDFRISVNNDSTINFNTTNFQYNHNKNADFDMVFNKSYRPDASAFGFDAGIVYEFRGNLDHFKYIRSDDEKSYVADRRDVNKYIFKVGVSLLDAGMFSFDKPANVNSFSANVTNWDVRNAHYSTIKQFDTALARRVVANPNDPRKYNVYLPTALSVQVDIRFIKGIYLNAMAYRPVTLGSAVGNRFDNYGYYAITPRWEVRHFGLYIPYTIVDKNSLTSYKQNMLGATVRLGPVFIGSSNLGTMAFNKNLRAADVHVGLKIGITYGKPTKASRFFERKHNNNNNTINNTPGSADNYNNSDTSYNYTNHNYRNNNRNYQAGNNLLVDYNKGHIYNDGTKTGGIIIINNNYYYRANGNVMRDTSYVQQPDQAAQMLNYNRAIDSVNYRRTNDSTKKVLKDSLSQKRVKLDSMINQLQLLRTQMDSMKVKDSSSLHSYNLRRTNNNPSYKDTISNSAVTAYTYLKPTRKDSLNYYAQLLRDSMNIRNQFNNAAINNKKKRVSDNDTLIIMSQMQNVAMPVNSPNYQYPYSQNQLAEKQRQNDLYERTLQQSNRLQSEISNLQSRINNQGYAGYQQAYRTPRNYNNNIPYVVAATPNLSYNPTYIPVPAPTAGYKYRRDTVYIRDTVHIKDTMSIVKVDTIFKHISGESKQHSNEEQAITKSKVNNISIPEVVILFSVGKTAIKPVYFKKLDYMAYTLANNASLMVSVTGHTDKTGPAKINRILSLKRANAVEEYLFNRGVDEKQLKISALSNPDADNNSKNGVPNSGERRVEVKIIQN